MHVVLLLLVGILLAPTRAAAQPVIEQFEGALSQAEAALGAAFARALPLPAASSGVSYSFDAATGNFRRDPSTFGQVYLQRADPIGARRVNVSFAYEYVQLEEIDGHDADNLRDPLPIPIAKLHAAFEIPTFSVKARVHQFLFAGTYGITDDLEVTAALPVIYSDLESTASAAFAAITPEGRLVEFSGSFSDESHPVGVGDVFLRAKYRFLELSDVHIASSVQLRLPSGSQEDLQGIGFVEVTPTALVSTRIFESASWARLQGHFNAGIGFNADDVDSSAAFWGIGLDWGLTDDLSAALAFLGQNQFAAVAPPGSFDFPRCNSDLVMCAAHRSERDGEAPLFGLTGERPDYYNVAIGGRGGLWRDTLFAFVSVAIPLNDGFVRTAPIPLVGFEGTF